MQLIPCSGDPISHSIFFTFCNNKDKIKIQQRPSRDLFLTFEDWCGSLKIVNWKFIALLNAYKIVASIKFN